MVIAAAQVLPSNGRERSFTLAHWTSTRELLRRNPWITWKADARAAP